MALNDIHVVIESKRLSLINIYGPNIDTPEFFEEINNKLELFKNESCIICGDFNLVLDPDLDYDNYNHINNQKSRHRVLELIQDKHLIDIFRELNPDTQS